MKHKVIATVRRIYADGHKTGLRGYALECGHIIGPHTRGARVGAEVYCARCAEAARPLALPDERARFSVEGWVVVLHGSPFTADVVAQNLDGMTFHTDRAIAVARARALSSERYRYVATRATLTVQAPTVVRVARTDLDLDEID